MPHKSSVPLYWRLRKSKYKLIGNRCTNCDKVFFPPRAVCTDCRSKGQLEEFEFTGNGKIVSWTVIRTPPEGFERDAPYIVALIELDEGTNVVGQIVASVDNGVKIGKKVQATFRKLYSDGESGLIHYGLKFELVG
jgi:uncharacterized OB-fold protein